MDGADCYSDEAVLVAIREWFNIDHTYAICLDIERVRPYLSREFRDVFKLYAYGYTPTEIARYWAKMRGQGSVSRGRGREILKKLVREIQRYLSLYLYELDQSKDNYLLTRQAPAR